MIIANSFQNSVHCSVLDKLLKSLFKTDTPPRYSIIVSSSLTAEALHHLENNVFLICIFNNFKDT